jgi:hypothetical protein
VLSELADAGGHDLNVERLFDDPVVVVAGRHTPLGASSQSRLGRPGRRALDHARPSYLNIVLLYQFARADGKEGGTDEDADLNAGPVVQIR